MAKVGGINRHMSTQPKESAARRKILDTAADLFYQDGIRATGIDAVIKKADVARMTLYKYFPTKDALVEAFLREKADMLADVVICTDSGCVDASPRERLLALFDALAARLLSDDYRGCPFINAAVESADPASTTFCAVKDYKARLENVIRQRVGALGVPDEEQLTQQLLLICDGASVRAQLGYAESAVPAARQAVVRLIDDALRGNQNAGE